MTSSDWICPVDGRVKFYDSWGERRSGNRRHEGVDLVSFRNAPILAPVDGVVTHRWDTIGGWSFDLVAEDGDYYFGTHMSGLGKAGEVRAGDVIGSMGEHRQRPGACTSILSTTRVAVKRVNAYPIVDSRCSDRRPWARLSTTEALRPQAPMAW